MGLKVHRVRLCRLPSCLKALTQRAEERNRDYFKRVYCGHGCADADYAAHRRAAGTPGALTVGRLERWPAGAGAHKTARAKRRLIDEALTRIQARKEMA